MSVKPCHRKDCKNIMCNRLSAEFGYICDDCFEELIDRRLMDIKKFMKESKDDKYIENAHREYMDKIFIEE